MKAFAGVLPLCLLLAGCIYGHPVTGLLPAEDGGDAFGPELLLLALSPALIVGDASASGDTGDSDGGDSGSGAASVRRFVIVGEAGAVHYSDDDGQNWTAGNSGVAVGLNAVTYTGSNRWVAVGDSGTVLYSDDGGQTWTSGTGTGSEALMDVASDGAGRTIVISNTSSRIPPASSTAAVTGS